MKITVDLPDDLLMAANKKAAELQCSLETLVESGLRVHLHQFATRPAANREIKWVTADGGLPPGLDISSREAMYEWLQQSKH
jgi:hypothetical protein